jgi:hypothetical protein
MNFLKKLNYSKPKVTIVSLFLLFSLTIAPIHIPKAHALWGEFPAQIFNGVLEDLAGMIHGLILGGLKTAAITSINLELSGIIGGSSSQSAKFITNWQDFLVDQPKASANIAMNDYLSQTISQGRGSASGYISAVSPNLFSANYEGFGKGSFSYGMAMNNPSYGKFSYFAQADSDIDAYKSSAASAFELKEMGIEHTSGKKDPVPTYNGEDLADASNNFENMGLYLSGVNNKWGYDINEQAKYAEILEEEKTKAITKAQSGSGFAEAGDQVTTPGIVVKDALVNAQDIGNKLIAAAKDPSEIITATIQSMITKSIQNGIGQASVIAQRTIQNTQSKATSEFNIQASQSGVGALFKN